MSAVIASSPVCWAQTADSFSQAADQEEKRLENNLPKVPVGTSHEGLNPLYILENVSDSIKGRTDRYCGGDTWLECSLPKNAISMKPAAEVAFEYADALKDMFSKGEALARSEQAYKVAFFMDSNSESPENKEALEKASQERATRSQENYQAQVRVEALKRLIVKMKWAAIENGQLKFFLTNKKDYRVVRYGDGPMF